MKTIIRDVSNMNEDVIERATLLSDIDALAQVDAAISVIREAGDVLKSGGLVAFPTETVYGLGADAFNAEAVARVYAAKGRPSDNPMIVHIARASDLGDLTPRITPDIVKLADAFWPGPLTMVLPKSDRVPTVTTGGLDTVAVRLPDNPVAIELIRAADTPIAAPSANLSGGPSPTKADHVINDLDGRIDMILAGTDSRVGIESTVVDMTASTPTVLRPGVITADLISAVLGVDVIYDPSLNTEHPDAVFDPDVAADGAQVKAPKSPGMKYKHYAPKADMLVVEGLREKAEAEIARLKGVNEQLGNKVGVILFEEKDYIEAAHEFYAELRRLDDEGVDLILAGALAETDGVGFAVMNRMLKSAGYNIVRV